MPPQTRMLTRNGPRTPIQGSSVGVQEPTTFSRNPKTPVPQPASMGTVESEFRGAIQMLTQLVDA
ncbi:hypothetical protein HAX54_040281, partial [Datura stramonium]|nr:hypothetical protein [Datura stramonium]